VHIVPGVAGASTVPWPFTGLKISRLEALVTLAGVWTNATCVPSWESTVEVTTVPPVL